MASWDISALYRHGASVVLPSPSNTSGHRVISSHRDRVVLRDLESLQVLRTWSLPLAEATSDSATAAPAVNISEFAVSPTNPPYVLVFAAKARTAWILDPDQDGEMARIDIGNEGAVAMRWAQSPEPTVMSWSAHHLRLSLFPIASTSSSSSAFHILSPKYSPPSSSSTSSSPPPYAGHSFHPDGTYLVSLKRSRSSSTASASASAASSSSSQDVISIYASRTATSEWTLVRSFGLPLPPAEAAQVDLAGVSWSPCGRYIAAWTSVTDYRIFVLSPLGHLLGDFAPYASLSPSISTPLYTSNASKPSARPAAVARPPKPSSSAKQLPPEASAHDRARSERSTAGYVGLGIRTVEWHPSGEYLAVGGWDGKIRILTRFGWVAVAELSLPASSSGGAKLANPTTVWREPPQWVEKTRGRGILSFECPTLPYPLPLPLPLDLTRPNPRMGIERIVWSPSGEWLAVLNAGYPTVLAIYSFPLPTSTSTNSSLPISADNADSPDPISSSSKPFEPCRLHTVLLFTPDAAANEGPGPGGYTAYIRDFTWQPAPMAKGDEADELDYGEETFASQEEEEDRREETLVVVTGQKGFATWRAPRRGNDGVRDKGIAECVGMPAQTDFAASSLSFAPASRTTFSPPLLISSNSAATTTSSSEGTFCVAYPVPASST
ncbi:hypothetical protein JCM10908_002566 [Rhodotorula pacifica]|uniref:WD40 repeat domain-containing protein n=1 Tax=Rhodotorula pacifica TaxID=1495444 RepID=UPI00317C4116